MNKKAIVDDEYHTYDNWFLNKDKNIVYSSVRPNKGRGYKEIDYRSDYWQPDSPQSSTGKAYEKYVEYNKKHPKYEKLLKKHIMNKQSALEQIKRAAFEDEMEKVAGTQGIKSALKSMAKFMEKNPKKSIGAAAALALTPAALIINAGPAGKELRDPRLYSNLRGMVSFESAAERVAAHKKLREGGTILSAMKSGFLRK